MPTGNTFPAPIGVTVSYTNVPAGGTTANFTWLEPGLYTISLEMDDENQPGGQVLMQSVSSTGALSTALTLTRPGYYNHHVPVGGKTYNFTTVNRVKNVRMTRMF